MFPDESHPQPVSVHLNTSVFIKVAGRSAKTTHCEISNLKLFTTPRENETLTAILEIKLSNYLKIKNIRQNNVPPNMPMF